MVGATSFLSGPIERAFFCTGKWGIAFLARERSYITFLADRPHADMSCIEATLTEGMGATNVKKHGLGERINNNT